MHVDKQEDRSQPGENQLRQQEAEVKNLRSWAFFVTTILILLLISSIAISTWLLSPLTKESTQSTTDLRMILLCIFTGMLGSSVSAMISVVDRISHGWELSDGTKLPKSANKPDMFVARMIAWFLVRPLLGSAMGFLIYAGIVGGYLIAVKTSNPPDFSPHGLAFLSFLGGLFAKTFLEKLKDVFSELFGS